MRAIVSLVPSPPHPSFCLAAVEIFSTAARQKLEWGGLGTRLSYRNNRLYKTQNASKQV